MDCWKIDEEFIRSIRIRYGVTEFLFDDNDDNRNIIQLDFEHTSLLDYNTIDESILEYYFKPTKNELTDDEFNQMINTGYAGERTTALAPFSVIIFGAYYARMDLVWKLRMLITIERNICLEGKSDLNYLSDFIPYFKKYAEGFKDGYSNFLKNKVEPFLPPYPDKTNVSLKVFDFITTDHIGQSWGCNHSGFVTQREAGEKNCYIIQAFEDGQKQGYYYYAWQQVLSNSHLYAPLFKNLDSNKELNPLAKIWLPQAKISIEDFLKKGNEAGIWDDNYHLITKRGSVYGTGKTLLSSLYVALKGCAINSNIDYKTAGTAFCSAFNIQVTESTNPYKSFQTGNPKYIKEFKRLFKIT